MYDKARATKSTDSCRSTHSRWENGGYGLWRGSGRRCDAIADILANAHFKEVSVVITENDNSVVTLLITYNSHPWIMFSLNWLVIILREVGWEVLLKLDVQGQGGRKISDVGGQGVGVFEIGQFSSTSYVYHHKKNTHTQAQGKRKKTGCIHKKDRLSPFSLLLLLLLFFCSGSFGYISYHQ